MERIRTEARTALNITDCIDLTFSSVQSLSRVLAARQASLSITNSRSSLRFTSIESVMPSSHLILCRHLLIVSISYRCYRGLNEAVPAKQPLAQCLEWSKLFLCYFITTVIVLIVVLSSFLTGLLPQGCHSSPIHLLGHF